MMSFQQDNNQYPKIKSSFRKSMQTQYSVLSYMIDISFYDYKLAI